MAELVKPGGWIVLEEPTATVEGAAGPAWATALSLIEDQLEIMGTRVGVIDEIWLEEDGFENVQEKVYKAKYGAMNPDPDLARKGVSLLKTTVAGLATASKSK